MQAILAFYVEEGCEAVAVFGAMVEEYGEDAYGPNRGWVNISYLEGLSFFEPQGLMSALNPEVKLQTAVFQTLIKGIISHAKSQGMRSAFIWSNPPRVRPF